jgi:hypothetical protein
MPMGPPGNRLSSGQLQGRSDVLPGRALSACLQVPPDYWAAIDAAAHLAKRVVVLTVPTSIIGEPLRQQQGLWQQRNKVRPGPLVPMCSGQAPGQCMHGSSIAWR